MTEQWRIELLGGLHARRGEHVVTRFRTQKTGALLAYLAYYQQKARSREVLIDSLWPDSDAQAGRLSLRVALSTLRHLLEPEGVAAGSVLVTDRSTVRLHPAAVTTDVAEFEATFQNAANANESATRIQLLAQVAELYGGPLLAGYYEDWIPVEEQRLEGLFFRAIRLLTAELQQSGQLEQALHYAQRAVGVDPLLEEARRDLMRLYVAVGELPAALRQYHEFEQLLEQQWGETPSAAMRDLAKAISQQAGKSSDWKSRPTRRAAINPPATIVDAPCAPELSEAHSPAVAGHLPRPLTRFFGRSEEFNQLKESILSRQIRLMTLTGAGGSGKTRLALEVAWGVAEDGRWRIENRKSSQQPALQSSILDPPSSVLFVPLADLTEPDLILKAILETLGVPSVPNTEPLEQVIAALSHHHPTSDATTDTTPDFASLTLLVLDNFEQLVTAGAPLVQSLLERVPSLTCLVTSRQRLNLPGEHEWVVLPLPTPEVSDDPEQLMQNASVQLFCDRAQAVRASFQLTKDNAGEVTKLCRQLDGIPLALELAAARAGVLTPAQMAGSLGKRLDLFTSRQHNVATRHRTLRATIDWSFKSLAPELQQFFTRLSIFRGGCTAEAVEVVCETSTALDCLEQLRESSFIIAEEHADAMRFRMLETLREYALDQLLPEDQEYLAQRHSHYYAILAESAAQPLNGPDAKAWLDRLETEHDNFREALQWSLENDAETTLRLAGALGYFWYVRGHINEGRLWLEKTLSQPVTVNPAVRALALRRAGVLAWGQGEFLVGRALVEEAIALYRQVQDNTGVAKALTHLGIIARDTGEYAKARSCFEESITLLRDSEHKLDVADPLFGLGSITCCQGDYDRARTYFRESLELHRAANNRRGIALLLSNLGATAGYLSDYTTARALYEESLALRRDLNDKSGVVYSLVDLGGIAHSEGDYATARALYEESLSLRRELGDKAGIANTLYGLASVAGDQGDVTAARALYLQSLNASYEIDDRSNIIMPLEALAHLEAQADNKKSLARAVRLFGVAQACRDDISRPLPPSAHAEYNTCLARLRAALGDDVFNKAWTEGKKLTWERAVIYASGEFDFQM